MKLPKGTRVLTVQQPWATLIALGEHPIEHRSWLTSYRGTLAIASSKGFPKNRREQCDETWVKRKLRKHDIRADDLPLGKILCLTTLVECHKLKDGYGFELKDIKKFVPLFLYRQAGSIADCGSGMPNRRPVANEAAIWQGDASIVRGL